MDMRTNNMLLKHGDFFKIPSMENVMAINEEW